MWTENINNYDVVNYGELFGIYRSVYYGRKILNVRKVTVSLYSLIRDSIRWGRCCIFA